LPVKNALNILNKYNKKLSFSLVKERERWRRERERMAKLDETRFTVISLSLSLFCVQCICFVLQAFVVLQRNISSRIL
jgi:hypothetical protein